MHIRKYQLGEETELWRLFFATIHNVNIRDYTAEQVEAWAPDTIDKHLWRARIETMQPYVCVAGDDVVGYAGLLPSGYIDHFYVHHERQGQGVGKLLYAAIEADAHQQNLDELTADVSITARPFFTARGFTVVAQQEVSRGTTVLRNFKMIKRLSNA
ncbi:putative N-acetyltransferase YafP [Symmachiella macrocystis]|uniref:Putative N-acetyltransferase YafP n=1 Tax=Symmachiella macrocystis TaxID=2527985 RepID=A0A5C6B6D0_9PLAN|nr:GNAT family N-acetyltransferase [Symmachiella macrocystis]TWU07327.1 putative N-acetyltransferase YafP [Symmachiella macrocystis]